MQALLRINKTNLDLIKSGIKKTDHAGLNDSDLEMLEAIVPDFKFGDNEVIISDMNEDIQDKKNHVKNVKELMKENNLNVQSASYFCVTFKTYNEKAEYLESIGINGDMIYLNSAEFLKRINE